MDAEEEGRKHYRRYGTEYRNPYSPGTSQHNDFERGWSQELKKHPEVADRIERKKKGQRAADDLRGSREREDRERKHRAAASEYKNAKGK